MNDEFAENVKSFEISKKQTDLANTAIFRLTTYAFSITKDIRAYTETVLSSYKTRYDEEKATDKKPDPTTWIVRMNKTERLGKKLRKKLTDFDILLQKKRGEFMTLNTKIQSLLLEIKIIHERTKNYDEKKVESLLKRQQDISKINTKINKLNALISKVNASIEQFNLFGQTLENGILLFPGETVTPVELEIEISNIKATNIPTTEDFYATLSQDLLATIPTVEIKIDPIKIENFNEEEINDRISKMNVGFLGQNKLLGDPKLLGVKSEPKELVFFDDDDYEMTDMSTGDYKFEVTGDTLLLYNNVPTAGSSGDDTVQTTKNVLSAYTIEYDPSGNVTHIIPTDEMIAVWKQEYVSKYGDPSDDNTPTDLAKTIGEGRSLNAYLDWNETKLNNSVKQQLTNMKSQGKGKKVKMNTYTHYTPYPRPR